MTSSVFCLVDMMCSNSVTSLLFDLSFPLFKVNSQSTTSSITGQTSVARHRLKPLNHGQTSRETNMPLLTAEPFLLLCVKKVIN